MRSEPSPQIYTSIGLSTGNDYVSRLRVEQDAPSLRIHFPRRFPILLHEIHRRRWKRRKEKNDDDDGDDASSTIGCASRSNLPLPSGDPQWPVKWICSRQVPLKEEEGEERALPRLLQRLRESFGCVPIALPSKSHGHLEAIAIIIFTTGDDFLTVPFEPP